MNSVEVASLAVGTTAQCHYYSEKGELLISKGVFISQSHLDTFARRNIFEVYIKPASEDEEISSLLTKEFKSLGDVDIGDQAAAGLAPEIRRSPINTMPLQKLLVSEQAIALDKQLGKTADRPLGPALRNKATQMTVQQRTEEYKTTVSSSYESALKDVQSILNQVAFGGTTEGTSIRNIVERFVKIFISDRNILLNLSSVKPPGKEYIYHHSLNVCLLAINIAASSGYNEKQIIEIGMGALLHDIGMLLLPFGLRTKEGRLTEGEWFEIQKHPILGLHLLEKIGRLPEGIPFVAYQVHERENATGYPKQRSSLLIHRFAKLVQIADVYEALTSPRGHREAFIPHEGVLRLIKMSKTGLIPGEYVKAFLEYSSLYPVGSLVMLSDNRIGKVVQSNKEHLTKPIVSIITDSLGKLVIKTSATQDNLLTNNAISITNALPSNYLTNSSIMDGF